MESLGYKIGVCLALVEFSKVIMWSYMLKYQVIFVTLFNGSAISRLVVKFLYYIHTIKLKRNLLYIKILIFGVITNFDKYVWLFHITCLHLLITCMI